MSRVTPQNHLTRAAPTAAVLPRPRGRTQTREAARMNKGETAYARVLDQRKAAGHVRAWWFEFLTLRLADSTHYKPDFLVMLADGTLELHEVKGRKRGKDGKPDTFWAEEDAWQKVKITAELCPFPIRVVWPGADGHWQERCL